MDKIRRSMLKIIAVMMLLAVSEASAQQRPSDGRAASASNEKAVVVLAADLRELTSLRDVDHVGDVFFRRVDRSQGRASDDYDLALRGAVAADWKRVFGRGDDNRAPRVFAVEPGTYYIEKINIGGGPTTRGPGLDPQTRTPRFGSFSIRAGEVINLGRLVVHMHWDKGFFSAKVEDNSADAVQALGASNPQAAARLRTRLMSVVPQFAFQSGGGRF
ncbi:hypothetical protein [Bradyrhizobium sp. HKCCYLR20261]|uniref:hypothetical protein n=1 Tax=Bradyrhizobium sp. HKCCYLR20261 TaxID=3420760 RepID=UPI003EC1028C